MAGTSIEQLHFSSGEIRIGSFRCPVNHPQFTTAGSIEGYTVCFPRTAVWIQHAGQPPFVADPRVATIYNRGQAFVRRPLAPDGDRTDWFSVSRELAESIATGLDPSLAENPERPFPVPLTAVPADLYLRQRFLYRRTVRGGLDPLDIEERVICLVAEVLGTAIPDRPRDRPKRRVAVQRDAVEAVRAELAKNPFERVTIRSLARAVGLSPFHLCRLFRKLTGVTIHDWLLDLRIRHAFEHLEAADRDLSRIAHRLGFSSHSHFATVFRQAIGTAPSRIRKSLVDPGDAGTHVA